VEVVRCHIDDQNRGQLMTPLLALSRAEGRPVKGVDVHLRWPSREGFASLLYSMHQDSTAPSVQSSNQMARGLHQHHILGRRGKESPNRKNRRHKSHQQQYTLTESSPEVQTVMEVEGECIFGVLGFAQVACLLAAFSHHTWSCVFASWYSLGSMKRKGCL
jgi:hypothetical protein